MKEQKTTSLEKLIARYGELKLSASSTTSGSDKKIGAATLPALNNAIANFIAMESNHADDGELTDAQTVPCCLCFGVRNCRSSSAASLKMTLTQFLNSLV